MEFLEAFDFSQEVIALIVGGLLMFGVGTIVLLIIIYPQDKETPPRWQLQLAEMSLMAAIFGIVIVCIGMIAAGGIPRIVGVILLIVLVVQLLRMYWQQRGKGTKIKIHTYELMNVTRSGKRDQLMGTNERAAESRQKLIRMLKSEGATSITVTPNIEEDVLYVRCSFPSLITLIGVQKMLEVSWGMKLYESDEQ